MKTVVATVALLVLAGCPRTSSVEPEATAPVAASESTPDVIVEPGVESKILLTRAVLGVQDLGDWSVRMGYDLGMLRMLVLTRPADANPVTVAQLTDAAPGVSEEGMTAVFSGAEVAGAHPFELLGYDHVQARTSDALAARGRQLPRLEFSWLRVDPDTGERESGRGTAVWMHCQETPSEAKAIDGRWLVLASETKGVEHDATPVSELAARLELCARP
jgi:hypothetical protein